MTRARQSHAVEHKTLSEYIRYLHMCIIVRFRVAVIFAFVLYLLFGGFVLQGPCIGALILSLTTAVAFGADCDRVLDADTSVRSVSILRSLDHSHS